MLFLCCVESHLRSWLAHMWYIWRLWCQKQVSQAGISNYIPQFTGGVITYPCLRNLLLAPKSWQWVHAVISTHNSFCSVVLTALDEMYKTNKTNKPIGVRNPYGKGLETLLVGLEKPKTQRVTFKNVYYWKVFKMFIDISWGILLKYSV